MVFQDKRFAEFFIYSIYTIVVFYLEVLLPRPFIWGKWGISNAFILFLIYKKYPLDWYIALAFVKSIFSGIITGNLLTPVFLFSISGGIVSVLVMYCLLNLNMFSFLSISIVSSIFNNITQLWVADLIGILSWSLYVVWAVIIYSIVTGSVTGILSSYFIKNEFNFQ